MEASLAREIADRAGHRHARSLVTAEAKRLLLMAARTLGAVLPRRDRVHGEKVVRVDLAGPHATVVAIRTESLGVAARAETAVVARDAFVALEPVGAVLGVMKPRRGLELAFGKARDEQRVVFGKVAGGARARRFARVRSLARVAAEAAAHARELVDGREPERADRAVTRRTRDAALGVDRVIEAQMRRG
jgi:hypothetical protein